MLFCMVIRVLFTLITISMNFLAADVMMINAVTLLFWTALPRGGKAIANEMNKSKTA